MQIGFELYVSDRRGKAKTFNNIVMKGYLPPEMHTEGQPLVLLLEEFLSRMLLYMLFRDGLCMITGNPGLRTNNTLEAKSAHMSWD